MEKGSKMRVNKNEKEKENNGIFFLASLFLFSDAFDEKRLWEKFISLSEQKVFSVLNIVSLPIDLHPASFIARFYSWKKTKGRSKGGKENKFSSC